MNTLIGMIDRFRSASRKPEPVPPPEPPIARLAVELATDDTLAIEIESEPDETYIPIEPPAAEDAVDPIEDEPDPPDEEEEK